MGRKPRGACAASVPRNCRYCKNSAASASRRAAVGAVDNTRSITAPEVLDASRSAALASSATASPRPRPCSATAPPT